jgi:hypothetical protein
MNNKLISKDLLVYIEKYLNDIPCKIPIIIEENIPIYIKHIIPKITEEQFIEWRNNNNNNNNIDSLLVNY